METSPYTPLEGNTHPQYETHPQDDTMSRGFTPRTDSPGDKGPKEVSCCVCFGCSLGDCLIRSENPDVFSGVEYLTNNPFGESAIDQNALCCVCCGVVIMTEQHSRKCATECGKCLNCAACIATVLNGCFECFKVLGTCLECIVKVLPW
jgi:hypothetical protein